MKGERITKDMLSPDTQLGGARTNFLADGINVQVPEYPGMNASKAQMAEYAVDCTAYYTGRDRWHAHTQPGGKTFDFSDDGIDRMASGVPMRDEDGD